MTNSALAEFLCWLMSVATIALLMRRKRRLDRVCKLMASAALGALGFAGHLFRIHVLFVRETLEAELGHLRRKTDSRSLRVHRRLVAHDAHLTRRIAEVFGVALYASRVTWKRGGHAIVDSLMTKSAVFCLGLVLGARMVEGRCAVDDY